MFQSGSYINEFTCSAGFTCDPLSLCSTVDECQTYLRRNGLFGSHFAYSEQCSDIGSCVYHICTSMSQTGFHAPLDSDLESTRHCLHQHWSIRVAVIVLSVLFLVVLMMCCLYWVCCWGPATRLGSTRYEQLYGRKLPEQDMLRRADPYPPYPPYTPYRPYTRPRQSSPPPPPPTPRAAPRAAPRTAPRQPPPRATIYPNWEVTKL